MDPHRYWIATGKGMERPFIGEFNDVIIINKYILVAFFKWCL